MVTFAVVVAAAKGVSFDLVDDGNRTTSCCGTAAATLFPAETTSPSGVSPFCWGNVVDDSERGAPTELMQELRYTLE